MKKAQRTDLFREMWNTKNRFLSILCIVALGVAFYAGVRSAEPDMQLTVDSYYDDMNFFDLRILGTQGFTAEDVEVISQVEGVRHVEGSYAIEAFIASEDSKFVANVFSVGEELNTFQVVEGKLPEKENECFMDEMFMEEQGYALGDTITLQTGNDTVPMEAMLKEQTYTIVGYGDYAQYLNYSRGTASIGTGSVDYFIGLPKSCFLSPVYTGIYVNTTGTKELNCYEKSYEDKVNQVAGRLETLAKEKEAQWYVLDRNTIESYVEYGMDANRIGAIGNVFPVIFFLVAALVSLTTMTRMVEEERIEIGTMKALGYGKASIISKYLYYAFFASFIGSIVGALIGSKVLPSVILQAYGMMYVNIPKQLTPINFSYSLLAIGLGVVCTVAATVIACYKELLATPAKLMRGAVPKQGKRVLLERIPFLWKRFNFTWKATTRNLIRYKKRFFMTVFGIGGCMALIMVGYGLRDSIQAIVDNQYATIWTYDAYATIEEGDQTQLQELGKNIEDHEKVEQTLYTMVTSKEVTANGVTKTANLFVPNSLEELTSFVVLKDRVTKKHYQIEEDGVVVTEKLAKLLELKVGDTITIDLDSYENCTAKITAIAENYMNHYVYMTKAYYEKLMGKEPSYNQLYMKLNDIDEKQKEELGKQLLGQEHIQSVTFVTELDQKVKDMMKSLDMVMWVLISSAGLLAFIVLYNLNNINMMERRRELATIKVLGFYDGELAGYVYRENGILTIVGIGFGVVLGIFLHRFIIQTCEIDIIMFGRQIQGMSYLYSILITIFFAIIVNGSMFWKVKKIDMVESLKSVE
ncbi:ABC transporter permease [Anaerosporobacter faecicola]|uniref:ABC transporter permease n=1 Tax=Anaerosporobacter faecicola TaxID=2718714 RepID=UPI001438815C|nr:FtsX-like permease family protein [Anaerosporobacter faecicola]